MSEIPAAVETPAICLFPLEFCMPLRCPGEDSGRRSRTVGRVDEAEEADEAEDANQTEEGGKEELENGIWMG